jgi:hypothetical protein
VGTGAVTTKKVEVPLLVRREETRRWPESGSTSTSVAKGPSGESALEELKQKMEMGILEPSSAPYSNRWFTVPKKNGTLRFIQDLQLVNKVTIRNAGTGPTIDEFAEALVGRSIYPVDDLYSGYD